jgi:hypothetical protein
MWIYDNIDTNLKTGRCEDKTSDKLTCENIIRKGQCEEGLNETFLEDKCTFYDNKCISKCNLVNKITCNNRDDCSWIYSDNSIDNEDGICYPKNDSKISCEIFKRDDQCLNGGNIINLNDICKIYDKTCKMKCDKLTLNSDGCTSNDRKNDCYLLEGSNEISQKCVDYVCLLSFYYILIYMYIILFLLFRIELFYFILIFFFSFILHINNNKFI